MRTAVDTKPMTPEEAALQMELLGHDFSLFANAETARAAVSRRPRRRQSRVACGRRIADAKDRLDFLDPFRAAVISASRGEAGAGFAPGQSGDAQTIRVLIADDQALFRRGLFVVLGAEDHIEVVAEAENGKEAMIKAEELAPDVVLMDVRMPQVNGIDAARHIRDVSPSTRILMLTVSDDEEDLFEAIKAGANGYLLKEISVEEVPEAIRAVAQGQSLISPSMASKLLKEFNALTRKAEERHQYPAPALTARELEVLRLVARGMTNREIADELYISENTVKNHVRNILEKLHLHTRMEAVIYAVRERLLDLRPGEG